MSDVILLDTEKYDYDYIDCIFHYDKENLAGPAYHYDLLSHDGHHCVVNGAEYRGSDKYSELEVLFDDESELAVYCYELELI